MKFEEPIFVVVGRASELIQAAPGPQLDGKPVAGIHMQVLSNLEEE
jgi:hypothetical protein